jgi:signal transduction histidine kinase
MIDRSLKRLHGMRNLIMDLLDLTKIESGKANQKIEHCDLVNIAHGSIDIMMPYAIQKDVEISLNAPEKLMKYVDPDEIEIIFNNLISNAIKYNKDGGTVEIDIYEDTSAKKTTLCVSDTGIGIKEDDKERLFGDFVRIKTAETKNIAGSGLGLSIVKKIVELNKGEITVGSVPDKGSVFTVILPI